MNKALELSKKYKTLLDKYKINTNLRKAHFFAQLAHESNLVPIEENLNYSENRLLTIFPKYFKPNKIDSKGKVIEKGNVKDYARNPKKIANRVYADRMGNGNEASGDGYKYRGRGFIQLTGKSNYDSLSKAVKVDYVNTPDKLLNEADSMIAALWFWESRRINDLADRDDVIGVTKKINGGTNGLSDRISKLKHYKQTFKN